MRDWKHTLCLPRTDFPMKGNLPKKEREILRLWEEISLYSRLMKMRGDARKKGQIFILHDGPPYANGDIHVGHVLNKVLKDIVVKWKLMSGYYCAFAPGWDTHGLPTEQEVIKEFGFDRKSVFPLEWRKKCRDFAEYYVERQKEQFIRLGCLGDWENPYLTYDPIYEAKEIQILGILGEKGLLYRRKKPIFWCPNCETALAEAEIEYEEVSSYSIYVAFPLEKPLYLQERGEQVTASLVIWTTTPWTLPANVAVAVHPTAYYSLYHTEKENMIVAEARWDEFSKKLGIVSSEKWKTWRGSDLTGLRYYHPVVGMPDKARLGLIEVFSGVGEYKDSTEKIQRVVTSEMVDLFTGTGMVHISPGHGEEDYDIGVQNGLPIFSPLDNEGRFQLPIVTEMEQVSGFGFINGKFYEEANGLILARLRGKGELLCEEEIVHSYPHCWRCKQPVIFRATPQWFLNIGKIRDSLIQGAESIQWFPSWGVERQVNMLKERPDWCLSRQRVWGVPLPIFYCASCGESILSRASVSRLEELVKEKGVDIWWEREAEELLPEDFTCPKCGNATFQKEKDIVDVWFDSGVSHFAVLQERPELTWPCDLYLEGSDQYRGWFQTSLTTSVAVAGLPPMRQILTHGFVVDQEGRKMSKSLGNVVEPAEILEKYGAEILRAWAVSADFTEDMKISDELLQYVVDGYRKIRNTLRFFLSNLSDYRPTLEPPVLGLRELDKWILHQWCKTVQQVHKSYESYQFHQAYRKLHQFSTVQLSAFYLEAVKDRLYVYPANSVERKAVQFTLSRILEGMLGLLAPILSFTAEEAYQNLPYRKKDVPSVFFLPFPLPEEEWLDGELAHRWEQILWVRHRVNQELEKKKQDGIREPLDAVLTIYAGPKWSQIFARFSAVELEEIFGTSGVFLRSISDFSEEVKEWQVREEGLVIAVEKAGAAKCSRCWKRYPSVGESEDHPELCGRCRNCIQ